MPRPTGSPSAQFRVSSSTLKTIANLYGDTLQRLGFRGQTKVWVGHLKELLPCTPNLRICAISDVIAAPEDGDEDEDEEEENSVNHSQSNEDDCIEATWSDDGDSDYSEHLSDSEEEQEYQHALHAYTWPRLSPAMTGIAEVHTLDLGGSISDVQNWCLLTLCSFTARLGAIEPLHGLQALQQGLERHANSQSSFAYSGTPIDLSVLTLFPLLEQLGFDTRYGYIGMTVFPEYKHLRTILPYRWELKPDCIQFPLADLYFAVQAARLPSLRTIHALGDAVGVEHVVAYMQMLSLPGISLDLQIAIWSAL